LLKLWPKKEATFQLLIENCSFSEDAMDSLPAMIFLGGLLLIASWIMGILVIIYRIF